MWNRWDGFLVVGLGTLVAIGCFHASQFLPFETWDVWFEGDLFRTYQNMVRADSDHSRTNLHPLITYVTYRPTAQLIRYIEPILAVRLVLCAVASVWVAILYLLLRRLECRPFDAGLLSILASTTAAAMFWLPAPETYSFGSSTVLLALLLTLVVPERSFWSYVALNVLTLSMTVTNWMAGLLATITAHSWKRSLGIVGATLVIVVVLSSIQKRGFPDAQYPFMKSIEEQEFLFKDDSGGPIHIIQSFFFHSVIMPDIVSVKNEQVFAGPKTANLDQKLSTQMSSVGSGTAWAPIAVLVWSGLLAFGLWALLTVHRHIKFRLVLGLLLGGQLLLHLTYGEETFLYALHFAPLLIIMVGLATLTRFRPLVLGLAALLVVTAGINNVIQFRQSLELVECIQQRSLSTMTRMTRTCPAALTKTSEATNEETIVGEQS